MEITEFAVKILILFLPGIICSYLDDRNTNVRESSIVITVVKSIIYSMISYGILNVIYTIYYHIYLKYQYLSAPIVNFFEFFNCTSNRIDITEVFIASFIAILISAIKTSYINITEECKTLSFNQKRNDTELNWSIKLVLWCNSLLENLRISKGGIGNKDVWDYVLTNQDIYVTVRDWDNNFAYMGKATINSSYNINGELYMEDVLIVDMDGYEADKYAKAVYLNKNDASSWDIIFNTSEETKIITDYIDELIKSKNNFSIQIKNGNNNNNNNTSNENILNKMKNGIKKIIRKKGEK